MNTNCSQSRLKDFTKSMAIQLQDDNLALTLQLWAESMARVLVFLYITAVMAGEIVQPYLPQLVGLFPYKTPYLGDVTDAAQEETVNVGGIY